MLKLLLLLVAGVVAAFVIVFVRGFWKAGKRHPAELFPLDFASAQGAVRMYQEAVEQRDIDAMVAAKDFRDEAEVMLRKLGRSTDDDLLARTVATLEATFRAHWKDADWPDLEGAKSFFSEPLSLTDNVVFLQHRVVFPNGSHDESQVRVVRRGAYWRVSHAPI